MEIVGGIVSFLLLFVFVLIVIVGSEPVQYDPPDPDEELRWLMEDQGLSEEDAQDIVDIPWRR